MTASDEGQFAAELVMPAGARRNPRYQARVVFADGTGELSGPGTSFDQLVLAKANVCRLLANP